MLLVISCVAFLVFVLLEPLHLSNLSSRVLDISFCFVGLEGTRGYSWHDIGTTRLDHGRMANSSHPSINDIAMLFDELMSRQHDS